MTGRGYWVPIKGRPAGPSERRGGDHRSSPCWLWRRKVAASRGMARPLESKAKGTDSPLAPPQRSPADLDFGRGRPFPRPGHKPVLSTARLCCLVSAEGNSQAAAPAGQRGWAAAGPHGPAVESGPSSQPQGSPGACSSRSRKPDLRSGLSWGGGPRWSAPGLPLPPCGCTSSGLLSHPGLCPRPLLRGVTAGALGPVSGPGRRCPLAPAMGILSTDSGPCSLLASPSVCLCWPETKEGTQPKTQTSGWGGGQSTQVCGQDIWTGEA